MFFEPDKEDQKNKQRVAVDELRLYFDGQSKDRLDHGRLGRKAGQVLAIREKLMSLPQEEFDQAIRTIEKVVSAFSPKPEAPEDDELNRQKDAVTLFERADGAGAGTTDTQVSKI